MSIPKVSVIMSCYNGEKFLRESIDSILGQSFFDYEFIIVDDGSTDLSGQILEDYASKDSRIVLIRNSARMGLTHSLRVAISKSRGEYIARQDADDLSCNTRLMQQISLLNKNSDLILVGTGHLVIDGDGNDLYTPVTIQNNRDINKLLNHGNVFAHGSVMFRRDAYERAGGYDERFRCAQDYELWLRMRHLGQLQILNAKLYKWRLIDTSVSARKKELQVAYTLLALLNSDWRRQTVCSSLLKSVVNVKPSDALAIVLEYINVTDDQYNYSVMGNALLRCGDYKRARTFLFRSRKMSDAVKAIFTLNQKSFSLAKKIYCSTIRW